MLGICMYMYFIRLICVVLCIYFFEILFVKLVLYILYLYWKELFENFRL